jgi:hypothetical protein
MQVGVFVCETRRHGVRSISGSNHQPRQSPLPPYHFPPHLDDKLVLRDGRRADTCDIDTSLLRHRKDGAEERKRCAPALPTARRPFSELS